MFRRVAEFISYAFHPLLLATYLFIVLTLVPMSGFLMSNQPAEKLYMLILVFISTFMFPLLSILVMKYYDMLSSLQMHSRKERTLPFSFIALFYILSTYLFWSNGTFEINVILLFASMSILILLLTLVNLFWKISIHSAGMGGALGILWVLTRLDPYQVLYPVFILVILACGMVMTARLYLNCHTPRQVYGGVLLGFSVCYGVMMLAHL